jgi:hypothetical protein
LESIGDPDLENAVARIGIAESQENKLHRFLAGTVDESNPVALSKGSSTYTFERGGREYRITIDVETYDSKDKSITRSIRNAIQSPAFIITSTMCSAIICLLAFVSPYWSSPILGDLSDGELETLDSKYSLV